MRDTFGIRGLKQTPPLQPWTLTTTTARSGVAAAGAGVTAPGTRAAHRIHGIGRSPPGQSPPTRLLQSKVDVGKNTIGTAYVEADNDMETAVGKTIGGTPGTTRPRARAKATSVLIWRHTATHHHPGAGMGMPSITAGKTMRPSKLNPLISCTAGDKHGCIPAYAKTIMRMHSCRSRSSANIFCDSR